MFSWQPFDQHVPKAQKHEHAASLTPKIVKCCTHCVVAATKYHHYVQYVFIVSTMTSHVSIFNYMCPSSATKCSCPNLKIPCIWTQTGKCQKHLWNRQYQKRYSCKQIGFWSRHSGTIPYTREPKQLDPDLTLWELQAAPDLKAKQLYIKLLNI